ncbi:MAG: HNH endonuclease, partial [Deltaproteobacteria bacterium]|nr:HNH endonuclease [Deltaproteobacteria bacterium]
TAPPAELAKTAKAAPPAELAAKPGPLSSRYVDVATKRQVWIRDNGQCTYVDPLSRRRCSSRFGLQLDHIIPLACGGPTTMSNLRLLCAGHNRLAAQRVYGKKKMARYARLHL